MADDGNCFYACKFACAGEAELGCDNLLCCYNYCKIALGLES